MSYNLAREWNSLNCHLYYYVGNQVSNDMNAVEIDMLKTFKVGDHPQILLTFLSKFR